MKKILSFLFLLYTISVQALTITNDMLGETYSVTVGETITVLEKDGYPDEPMWNCPDLAFLMVWEYTLTVTGAYFIAYVGEVTKIEVYPVSIAVTDVSLSPSSLSGTTGGTGILTATVNPSNATDKSVTWESSDTSVATVSDGTVNYTGAGTATITVKTNDGNHTATAGVNVTPPVYPLTVISGTGSDYYEAGTQVPITANTPLGGKVFDQWTSDSGSFTDATSAGTVFTMPAAVATVTATYKDAPAATYALTVVNGSGSGNYAAGTEVVIVANTPANGKIFDTWTSDSGSFADTNSAGTTFTMPTAAATVTATYKDAPASVYTLTVINGSGSGNYTAGTSVPVTANTPPNGKVFDQWTSDSGNFSDATSAGTVFTMPAGAATVTAIYKDDIPDGTGEASDNELSVRGIERALYIRSPKDGTAYIYTISGRLVKTASYHAGETTIHVPAGIRIVRAGGRTFKACVK